MTKLALVWLVFSVATPKFLVDARKEYAAGEFERALSKLETGAKKVTDPNELAQVFLLKGQCLLGLGKPAPARAAFAAAVQKDPNVALNAERASPDAVSLLEQARATVPATLSVQVTEGAAVLVIDGKDMGPTPLQMQIAAGAHVVEARSEDGRTAKRNIDVMGGKKTELELALETPARPPPEPGPEPVRVPAPTNHTMTIEPSPVEEPVQVQRHGKAPGIALIVIGLLCAGASVFTTYESHAQFNQLTAPTGPHLTPADESGLVSSGHAFEISGWVTASVALAALLLGIFWLAAVSGGG